MIPTKKNMFENPKLSQKTFANEGSLTKFEISQIGIEKLIIISNPLMVFSRAVAMLCSGWLAHDLILSYTTMTQVTIVTMLAITVSNPILSILRYFFDIKPAWKIVKNIKEEFNKSEPNNN